VPGYPQVCGAPSKCIANELGLHEHTVGKWRRRFLKGRIEGLLDEARPGRPRTIDEDQIAAVIERTLRSIPADATHWSIRSMTTVTGFSHTTIRRIWTAFGLQPHRSQTFKLSSDPLFVDKVRDIVGLIYHRPTGRWSSASMRKAGYKPSIANSLFYR
jgi:transposase